MRTLIVTPTYQEADNIEEFLRRCRAAVPDADILVVDDSSPDGTAAIAERVAGELGQITLLHRATKEGLGEAYRAGLAWGIDRGYDVLVQIDADLSHDPTVIPALRRAVTDGAAMAIGSRYVPGGVIPHWPWFRRMLSRYGNRYAGFVLGLKARDATAGYRAYTAEALQTIDFRHSRAKGYGFQIEIAYRIRRHGGTIVEVPIVFTDRVRGHSKMTWGIFGEELLLVTWWGVRDRLLRRGARPRQIAGDAAPSA
ncbi:MAG TPA: polyprenol monophosphomannose synthase [Acidimicrobiia bacterium]|jgi:dolichol-phosphate mannosyltransferase